MVEQTQDQTICNKRLILGIIGCFGGLLIHLIIGSLYQWGIINIYITSYFRLFDQSVTLESNAIAFPIMMVCIGFTMRLGIYLSQITHPLFVLGTSIIIQSALIFSSSYTQSMGGFIVLYGVLFGFCSGLNFMIPIVQCNKYFPDCRMYVNGAILTGTGLGSLVFGLFSFGFLNPKKIPPIKGYYIGNAELENISAKVPQCLRWLSLEYLIIGLTGVSLIAYVCISNRRILNEIEQNDKQQVLSTPNQILNKNEIENNNIQQNQNELQNQQSSEIFCNQKRKEQKDEVIQKISQQISQNNQQKIKIYKSQPIIDVVLYPTELKQAFCTKVLWLKLGIIFFGSCGLFLMNGNYKTYVKNSINDDQLLTIIGVVGSIGQFIILEQIFSL